MTLCVLSSQNNKRPRGREGVVLAKRNPERDEKQLAVSEPKRIYVSESLGGRFTSVGIDPVSNLSKRVGTPAGISVNARLLTLPFIVRGNMAIELRSL